MRDAARRITLWWAGIAAYRAGQSLDDAPDDAEAAKEWTWGFLAAGNVARRAAQPSTPAVSPARPVRPRRWGGGTTHAAHAAGDQADSETLWEGP